jgi:hypothetical protein
LGAPAQPQPITQKRQNPSSLLGDIDTHYTLAPFLCLSSFSVLCCPASAPIRTGNAQSSRHKQGRRKRRASSANGASCCSLLCLRLVLTVRLCPWALLCSALCCSVAVPFLLLS